jgi:hypothetical protein
MYQLDQPAAAPDSRPFPDVILRSQFFELVGTRALTSEQRLMLAVLADAINVVQEFHGAQNVRKRTCFNEAWNWIFSRSVSSPLAFEAVCDALGMEPESLRWRLREMVTSGRVSTIRLRLKEASRMQRLTVNRVRRRHPNRMLRAARSR